MVYTINFLQAFWDLVGEDLVHVLNMTKYGEVGSINPSARLGLFKLILKITNHLQPKDWHPLTTLNVVYKVLAKTLAMRIKFLVSLPVHGNPFGFIHNHNIYETVLKAITFVDYAISPNKVFILLNVDLENDYDR